MAQYDNNTGNNNRICYVDPNDVRGSINGAPLTPDYTEFSIWCNLIVEPTSRLRNQAGGTNGDRTVISFNMTNSDLSNNQVSFMRGKDAENYNFLTTDYTNINYDEIRQRNIIEGLGVEDVNISFTNYQTPQITIKFIDIRGGGFFGREEATHNEYSHLTNLEIDKSNKMMDNVFSCFVSFPYPRFKLQVKGFYGRTVTYQLSCTNFTGNFNSQTGNFEITVQFIGYEYGILGDIPFDLLVAAPLTNYGSEYWDKHVHSDEWILDKDKTEVPQRLNDIYKKISKQLNGDEKENNREENIDVTEDIENITLETSRKIEQLNEIKFNINLFKDEVKRVFGEAYVTESFNNEEDVIIVYNTKQDYTNTANLVNLCDIRNKIKQLVENYNKIYKTDSGGISFDVIPNNDNNGTMWSIGQPLTFTNFIAHSDVNGHHNILVDDNTVIDNVGSCTDKVINKMFTGNSYQITEGVSNAIFKDLSSRTWSMYGKDLGQGLSFASFALAIQLGNTKSEIDNKITTLTENYNSYVYGLKQQGNDSISKIVNFTPYIGRYFKIVMCHLETFVALIYHYAQAIEEDMDNRTPEKLGIRDLTTETDVPGAEFNTVPAFPAVYKKYMTNAELDKALNNSDNIKITAWIGDFSGPTKWIEKDLVDEVYRAAQRIKPTREEEGTTVSYNNYSDYNYYSFMPVDIYEKIPEYAYTTFDGAFFYAALRAEIALDLMQKGKNITAKDAEILGMYDAYVYATQCKNQVFLNQLVKINQLSTDLYNSTVYGEPFKNKEHHLYEFSKPHEDRHPVFIENNNKVKYSFMINESGNLEFVPLDSYSTLENNNGFARDYVYNNGKDFEPKNLKSEDFLVASTNNSVSGNTYPNTHHFEIIINDTSVDKVKRNYLDFKKGKEKIGNKTSKDFTNTLNKHVLVDDNRFEKFYFPNEKNWFTSYDFTKPENLNINKIKGIY